MDVPIFMEQVRQGLSPYYTKYGLSQKYDKEFGEAERLARKEKLGIWGDPGLVEKYLRLKSKWGQVRTKVEWNYVASKKSKVLHLSERDRGFDMGLIS